MAVNIPGIVSVAVFYIAILLTGIIVGKKTSKNKSGEAVLIADRSFNLFVSVCTLTATNIGGGYILGTAESTAFYGLLQTVAPFGYFVAFFIGHAGVEGNEVADKLASEAAVAGDIVLDKSEAHGYTAIYRRRKRS